MEDSTWGWVALIGGLFCVFGAVFKWDIFMNDNHVTSRIWREFLGESLYRFVMVILGAFMFFLGLLLTGALST